jgi:large repetitive protein
VALAGTVSFTDSVTSAAIPGCSAVTITLNGTNGQAVCTTSGLAVSPPAHTITAAYVNDTNFGPSSSTFVQTVNPTAGAISLSPASGTTTTVNTSVTFTATIPIPAGLPAPKGVVTFTDNGNAIASCPPASPTSNWIATCTDQSLTAGPHTIVAAYTGDSNVSVNSGTTNIMVTQGASTTALTSNLNPSLAFANNSNSSGYTVTFKATISPPAGAVIPLSQGTVSFSGNGIPTACTAVPVAGGVATCTSVTLPSGTDSVVAAYAGDPNYAGSSGTVIQLVQDYSITVANVPTGSQGVVVTQGSTTATDPFSQSEPIAVSPASVAGFTSSGVTLTCASTASGAPACNLAASTTKISGVNGAQQSSIGIVIDATGASVAAGTYTFTVTATDSTSSIVRTATFPVTVRGAASGGNALTVISGATTNNTGNVTFNLPAGITLSNLQCASIVGTGITTAEKPAAVGVGCSIAPGTLGSLASTSAQNVTAAVTVTTNGTIAAAAPMNLDNKNPALLVAGVFGIPFIGLIGFLRRRSLKTTFFSLVAFVVLGVGALQTTGCGGSYHSSGTQVTGGTTPPGVYYLLVEGTGSDGNTYSAVLQLNVEL